MSKATLIFAPLGPRAVENLQDSAETLPSSVVAKCALLKGPERESGQIKAQGRDRGGVLA